VELKPAKRLRIILTLLNEAHELKDIDFPGSDLHPLKGDKGGFWSVKVSGNWFAGESF